MKNGLLVFFLLCSVTLVKAQDSVFKDRALEIAERIDSITSAEKDSLKIKIEKIEKQLDRKEITASEATQQKQEAAKLHADRINQEVAKQEKALEQLVQDKVDGKLPRTINDAINISFPEAISFINTNKKVEKEEHYREENRFTTQIIYILGINRAIKERSGYYTTDFREILNYAELGVGFKYRLKEDSPLWNFKFGLTMNGTDYVAKNKNFIAETNGDVTNWVDSGLDLKTSSFGMAYLTIPLHLELDLSKPKYSNKTNKYYVTTQDSFRFGIGGFIGYRVYSKIWYKYKANGNTIRRNERGGFNVNDWIFGPSAHVGYKDISFFVRYEVNPVFKNNPVKMNNLSYGLRIDLN